MSLLVLEAVSNGYGPVRAVQEVSLSLDTGRCVAVIGANGAGKSTLLKTICGVPRPHGGRVLFDGIDITGLPPHRIARLGIAHAPEGRRIMPRMTVTENLRLGALFADPAHYSHDLDHVLTLFPRLAERRDQRGGTLSGGEQQMLAIGRALMSRPRLLLLDEPSLGLAPRLVKLIFEAIRHIRAEAGTAILLVEQNAYQALALADHALVLANGRVVTQGGGRDLLADPAVRAAYLEGGQAA